MYAIAAAPLLVAAVSGTDEGLKDLLFTVQLLQDSCSIRGVI